MKNNTDLNADIDLKNQILKVFHFPDKRKNLYKVITQESDLIADCYNEYHAAFICKAVNEYDSLIEENKRLKLELDSWKKENFDNVEMASDVIKDFQSENKRLLEALKNYEYEFQKLLTTTLGKENEKSLKIWFSIVSSDAQNIINKIKL